MIEKYYPQLLEIGATGRNSGKTFFAKEVIHRVKSDHKIVALKIVTIKQRGVCQQGENGCGMCTSIDNGFELIEETNHLGMKDTMQMLQAGCKRVFMLKAFENSLIDGFEAFLKKVGNDVLVICESNSLRNYLKPGLFVMIHNQVNIKPSAQKVLEYADFIIKKEHVSDSEITVKFDGKHWIQIEKMLA